MRVYGVQTLPTSTVHLKVRFVTAHEILPLIYQFNIEPVSSNEIGSGDGSTVTKKEWYLCCYFHKLSSALAGLLGSRWELRLPGVLRRVVPGEEVRLRCRVCSPLSFTPPLLLPKQERLVPIGACAGPCDSHSKGADGSLSKPGGERNGSAGVSLRLRLRLPMLPGQSEWSELPWW